ncbi:hypothetical protein M5D96_010810, partial [Drosophila gunungcola]
MLLHLINKNHLYIIFKINKYTSASKKGYLKVYTVPFLLVPSNPLPISAAASNYFEINNYKKVRASAVAEVPTEFCQPAEIYSNAFNGTELFHDIKDVIFLLKRANKKGESLDL